MTMPTLVQICTAVQDVVGALSGIRIAPDVPTEQTTGGDVTAFCYPGTGSVTVVTAGRMQAQHTLHLQIITPRRNLRTDWARIVGLGDTVPRALLGDLTLAGTVLHINTVDYTFGTLEWGGTNELGWSFTLAVLAAGTIT